MTRSFTTAPPGPDSPRGREVRRPPGTAPPRRRSRRRPVRCGRPDLADRPAVDRRRVPVEALGEPAEERGVPPARWRSPATCGPPGERRVTRGVDRESRSKSSRPSATPASAATASRCSTAFVEPPVPATPTIAFERIRREVRGGPRAARDHVHHEPARRLRRAGFAGSSASSPPAPAGQARSRSRRPSCSR